jgi:quinone-reactive Ni/Fe-hydrogenase small subunit/[NiFe] hydrogenase small subunit
MPKPRWSCPAGAARHHALTVGAAEKRLDALEDRYAARGEDFDTLLTRKGVTRRDFLKWSSLMTAALGLPLAFERSVARAAALSPRIPVVWMHFQECTGCTESALRSSYPGIAELILDYLSMEYHETLMAPCGDAAEKSLEDALEKYHGEYLCVMEGSIPTKMDGKYLRLGPKGETGLSLGKRVAAGAKAVIAIGHCASHGGPQSAAPNPTGAQPVHKALGIQTVRIPGCPYNGVNLVGTILNFILFGEIPALVDGRPAFAYAKRIHDSCPRRAHFDAGEYVEQFGDEGAKKGFCLYKVGCKGPYTWNNCNEIQWNEAASFPIRAGHGCIGCSEEAFWDQMAPLEAPLAEASVSIPLLRGVEGSADIVGWTLVGASAVGIAGHAAYSAVVKKSQKLGESEE